MVNNLVGIALLIAIIVLGYLGWKVQKQERQERIEEEQLANKHQYKMREYDIIDKAATMGRLPGMKRKDEIQHEDEYEKELKRLEQINFDDEWRKKEW